MSQPVRETAAVTIAGGVATATFPTPPVGYAWTGSISVPGATSGNVNNVTWHATAGMAPQATFFNDLASGTIQCASGDTLTLVGVNLAAGTYTAYFVGVQDPIAQAPSVWPGPTPAPPPGVPQTVTQVTGSFTVGTSPVTIGIAPVIVGTSVAIFISTTGSARVTFSWSAPPLLNVLESFPFDVRSGASVQGLVLPNVGPQLQVAAVAALAGTNVTIEVFTGLPPITQEPVVPNGVLWSSAGSVAANGQITLPLAPYFGAASFTFSPNNLAGFGVYVVPSDYQGNAGAQIRNTQGWPAGTGPFFAQSIVFLPAQICNVIVDNAAVGSATTYSTSGVALGP